VRRPQSLAEVSRIACDDPPEFGLALREFLDEFYLDHPDKGAQAQRIAEAAAITGHPFMDAWMGGAGEHLAGRWGLEGPLWTQRPEHNPRPRPRFVPDAAALRGMLLVMSPPAFRARLLFTVAEPLTRARFPRDVKRIAMPLRWPE